MKDTLSELTRLRALDGSVPTSGRRVVVAALLLVSCTWLYFLPGSLPSILTSTIPQYNLDQFQCRGPGTDEVPVHPTKLAGGVPGFYVFDNLWYNRGTFYAYTDDPASLPEVAQILTGSHLFVIRPLTDDEKPTGTSAKVPRGGARIHCVHGESVLVNEIGHKHFWQTAYWNYHFYHFAAESVLGGLAALFTAAQASTTRVRQLVESTTAPTRSAKRSRKAATDRENNPSEASVDGAQGAEHEFVDLANAESKESKGSGGWLIVPWQKRWRDKYGLNKPFIRGLFGDKFIDRDSWSGLSASSSHWILLERVVIVDRGASHGNNPSAKRWNKMALPIFEQLPLPVASRVSSSSAEDFFEPSRHRMLDALRLPDSSRRAAGRAVNADHVKIVYIDRQGGHRRLVQEAADGLHRVFEELRRSRAGIGRVEVAEAKLEELSFEEQVQVVADADVIVGVHGNGLSHQMWMPAGGTVVEMFPPGTFIRDYQVLAEALGHRHIAIWEDREYPREEWQLHPGEMNVEKLHDGSPISLDTDYVESLLQDITGEMTDRSV